MPNTENKIKYGLKNVYYAVATIATDGSATFGTPVAFPGAVSLSLSAEGERSPFYADNIEYWVGSANNGYSGSLEMARLTDSFKKDILGYVEDSKHVVYEDADAQAIHFALIFQFEGDQNATRHVLYNCTCGRPEVSGSTKNETIEPQTETVNLSAKSIYVAALDAYLVKSETTKDTADADYESFTAAVYIPTA
jgi:phi13 family phage major tail protein